LPRFAAGGGGARACRVHPQSRDPLHPVDVV